MPTSYPGKKPDHQRIAGVLAVAATVALLLACGWPAASVVIDRVVATVNGEAITLYELYLAELPVFGTSLFSGQQGIKTPDDRAKERQTLDAMITNRLLLQRARKLGLAAEAEEVSAAIQHYQQSENLTDEMLEFALARQNFTMARLRDQFADRITLDKLRNAETVELRRQTVVTPEQVEAYYRGHTDEYTTGERAKIRHILIQKQDTQGVKDPRLVAQSIADDLISGADFQEMAQKYSQDSARNKGDVSEWIRKGDTLPELEQEIFGLEPGGISPVIETGVGYHIIKVESREPVKVSSLEDVFGEISNRLLNEKLQKKFREWLDDIRRGAIIEIRL